MEMRREVIVCGICNNMLQSANNDKNEQRRNDGAAPNRIVDITGSSSVDRSATEGEDISRDSRIVNWW